MNKLNKSLFILHTSPFTDALGISKILRETKTDKALQWLSKLINNGNKSIQKESLKLQKFKSILTKLMVSENGFA